MWLVNSRICQEASVARMPPSGSPSCRPRLSWWLCEEQVMNWMQIKIQIWMNLLILENEISFIAQSDQKPTSSVPSCEARWGRSTDRVHLEALTGKNTTTSQLYRTAFNHPINQFHRLERKAEDRSGQMLNFILETKRKQYAF